MATVRAVRGCSRSACPRPAVATLTYVYADSTAVLGPLATAAEPHAYDLCDEHASRLTVPRGWQVVRLPMDQGVPEPTADDISALADAVREASRATRPVTPPADRAAVPGGRLPSPLDREITRRGHLRVLQGDVEELDDPHGAGD